jgi:hypothetical protein
LNFCVLRTLKFAFCTHISIKRIRTGQIEVKSRITVTEKRRRMEEVKLKSGRRLGINRDDEV